MEKDYLQMLAQVVLPAEILEYFSIRGIEQSATEIHISLDEKMSPELSSDAHYESKGFMEAVNVTTFRYETTRLYSRSDVGDGQIRAPVKASVCR